MADTEIEAVLPKATISKMIKEAMPGDMRCAGELTDAILACSSVFAQLLAAQATELSNKDNKNVISTDHMLEALRQLGFAHYVPAVQESLSVVSQQASTKGTLKRNAAATVKRAGMSEEEQIRLQQEMLAAARTNMQ